MDLSTSWLFAMPMNSWNRWIDLRGRSGGHFGAYYADRTQEATPLRRRNSTAAKEFKGAI
jgi:hypothetical protein